MNGEPRPRSIEWFDARVTEVSFSRNDTYLTSYPLLLEAFSRTDPGNAEDFVLLAHAVFGWMPRILDLSFPPGERSGILSALKALSHKDSRDDAEDKKRIEILWNHIGTLARDGSIRGRSIVGVSKLLHFCYPDEWPIWDRTVANEWREGKNALDKVHAYQVFACKLRGLAASGGNAIANTVNQKLEDAGYDYKAGTLRALEMVLYYTGKKDPMD